MPSDSTFHNALSVDLLLDSGSFSAWLRQTTIDVKDYIAFIREHEELLHSYVSLDVIPGQHGRARTSTELQEAAGASYRNHQIMKDAGLSPIPVFHQGERRSWLEGYLRDGEPYVGISAFKDAPAHLQRAWLDEVFSILTDDLGRPIVKVHGFAITNHAFLIRYPFYSVDSATWSLGGSYGRVLSPAYVDGTPNYLLPPISVVASGVRQSSASLQDKHFEVRDERTKAAVCAFVKNEVGVDLTDLRYDNHARRRALLVYFLRLAERCRVETFKHRMPRLHCPVTRNPIVVEPLKIMFATMLRNRRWADLMTELGANTRLLSYWELRDRKGPAFEQFVRIGTFPPGRSFARRNKPQRDWKSESYWNQRRLNLARRIRADEQTAPIAILTEPSIA